MTSAAVKDLKCPVCQEDLDVYDEFAVTRCNNFYHQDEVSLHQECRTAWMKKHDVKNLKKSNGYPCPGPGCNGRVDHTHFTKHKRPKGPLPPPQQSQPGPQCKAALTPKQRQQQALQTQLAQQAALSRQQATAAAAARRAAISAEPEVPLALQVPAQKSAKAAKDVLPSGIPGAEAIVTPSKAKSKRAKRAKAAEQPSPSTEERGGSSRIFSPGFGSGKVRSEASEDGYGSSHSDQTTAHSGVANSWVTSLDRYNMLLAQLNAGSGEEEFEEEEEEEDEGGRTPEQQNAVKGHKDGCRDEGLERILREIAEEEEGEAELRRTEALTQHLQQEQQQQEQQRQEQQRQQRQQEQQQERERKAAADNVASVHGAPSPSVQQAPQQQHLPHTVLAPPPPPPPPQQQQQQFHAVVAPQHQQQFYASVAPQPQQPSHVAAASHQQFRSTVILQQPFHAVAVHQPQQQFHATATPQQRAWTARSAAAQNSTAAPAADWGGAPAPRVSSLSTPHAQASPTYQSLATAPLGRTMHHSAAYPALVAAYAQTSPMIMKSEPPAPVIAYVQQASPSMTSANTPATAHKVAALQQESVAEARGRPGQEEGDLGELLALCLGDA